MSRVPLVAAAAYVTTVAVGLFVVPSPPHVDASGQQLVAYYQLHADGARLVTWLGAISVLPLAVLFAHARTRLDGAWRDVFQIGAVSIVVLTLVWLWTGAGLALDAAAVPAPTARAIADTSAFFAPTLTVAVVLVAAPVALAARGGLALPRWLAPLSAVLVIEQLVESSTITSTHGFTAPSGTMNFTLGASLFLIWVLATGVALARAPLTGRGTDGATTRTAPAAAGVMGAPFLAE